MSRRRRLTLYTRLDCHLCDQAQALLEGLRDELAFDFVTVDIDEDAALRNRYGEAVPVIALDGIEIARAPIRASAVEARLRVR